MIRCEIAGTYGNALYILTLLVVSGVSAAGLSVHEGLVMVSLQV